MHTDKIKEAWRVLRIQSELVDGIEHLAKLGPAVSIYGSARLKPESPYYQAAQELAYKLADSGLHIITGGGPGIMEAANRGGFENPHGKSVGLNITLPMEQRANPHQDISLDFRYFFVRKLMFVKHAVAFVIFPGGYGTLDELFEALTLIQTEKINIFPVVLYGKDYWQGLYDWLINTVVASGCVDIKDMELFKIVDTVEEAEKIVLHSAQDRLTKNKPSDNMPESY